MGSVCSSQQKLYDDLPHDGPNVETIMIQPKLESYSYISKLSAAITQVTWDT